MQLQTLGKRMILRQRDMHSFLPKLSGVATDHLGIPCRYHHNEGMAANLADMHTAIALANIDAHQRMSVWELKDQIAQKAANYKREHADAQRSLFAPPSLTGRTNGATALTHHR